MSNLKECIQVLRGQFATLQTNLRAKECALRDADAECAELRILVARLYGSVCAMMHTLRAHNISKLDIPVPADIGGGATVTCVLPENEEDLDKLLAQCFNLSIPRQGAAAAD